MKTAVTALVTLFGTLAAAPALYLLSLALAAVTLRHARRPRPDPIRLAVVVPAHDEAELIQRCVRSLLGQSYPRGSYRVVVVADNCIDNTAGVALACGAEVLVREEPEARGKGHALRWAMDRILAEPMPPDAVVVVDADSSADPDLLWELVTEHLVGAEVVQADYLVSDEDRSPHSELVGLGFLLFHRVRFGGRKALGLPANLVGNGMLFSRSVVERQPWSAFTGAEDLEYSIHLRLAGIRPVFAPAARIYAPVPGQTAAASNQRLRWESGRFLMVRRWLARLVVEAWRRRDWGLLDAAVDLAVPPLGLVFVGVATGLAVATVLAVAGLVAIQAVLVWVFAAAALLGFIVVGLKAAGAPSSSYLLLLRMAPVYLLRKVSIYVKILRGDGLGSWVRTQRPGERRAAQPERILLAGVPIDPVDMPVAVERILGAVGGGTLRQICTVNLDFLVKAQTHADIARILAQADLNVADGAPVVWLSRLTGRRVPGRIAGADLVPQVVAAAAERGASVFLLGGQDGVAHKASAKLTSRYPTLRIAGVHEPPMMAIGAVDDDGIVGLVNGSGADILMVALGHPKQELWIDRNRDKLRVSVAIGVGCCLDLIAGHVLRAPRWMQAAGLEWLFRLLQEPQRLFGRYATDAAWLAWMVPGLISHRLMGSRS